MKKQPIQTPAEAKLAVMRLMRNIDKQARIAKNILGKFYPEATILKSDVEMIAVKAGWVGDQVKWFPQA